MTAEVAALVRQHVADVIGSAIGGVSSQRAVRAAPQRRTRKRRPDATALRAKLLAVLGASKKGASLADVVKRAGADRGAVSYHLRALRAQKKVKIVGTRGTARWLAA